MASFIRQGILAIFLVTALFSTSCEMHPLGQMPEVQREQPDPAKVWSEGGEHHSETSSTSEAPAEVQHESR